MPLHSTTVTAARMPRSARLAAIAATAATAGAFTIALAENGPAPQVRTIAESAQPAASRFFDLEANKAASMRALGEQIAVSAHRARVALRGPRGQQGPQPDARTESGGPLLAGPRTTPAVAAAAVNGGGAVMVPRTAVRV